ncbi:ABC transporter substrate-binding protein [Reyranella sp.]|uniref:ABC transporter substrate-binding protein n=1 Tax=Reyranella sp. TaxID=1929291 RepID=UPI0025EDD75F|nr:ABC transporter substrate-binding protein [Reyranella sp.]
MKINNIVRFGSVVAAALGLTAAGIAAIAQAQTPPGPLKIAVMDGFSGVYGDLTAGEVEAMQMAIEDVGGKVNGRAVEILSADHQTKPDIGAAIARKWYDVDGVKMITGLGTSSVALAVRKVSQEKGLIDINTGAASSDLTGPACSETGAHWVYDTYSLAHVTGEAMVKAGGDSWYFLTADYAFGHALERDVSEVVKQAGGKVLGAVRHPLSTQDFSSFLLQAQASKAKVIGLANAGQDTINSIKQAGEFGIVKGGQKLAGLLVFATDVQSLTLPVAQGLVLTESFYWDLNDETRAWTKRYRAKKDRLPSMLTAGVYSSTLHYLKAVQAVGSADDAKKVMAKMREMPVNDVMTKNGKLREDGRLVRDMHLFQVKAPSESKSKDDIYKLVATVPGDKAYRPMNEGKCPFVK